MSRNATDTEQRLAQAEDALRCLVKVLTQPGVPTAPWLRTTLGPNGQVSSVPQLFPALEPFAGPGQR